MWLELPSKGIRKCKVSSVTGRFYSRKMGIVPHKWVRYSPSLADHKHAEIAAEIEDITWIHSEWDEEAEEVPSPVEWNIPSPVFHKSGKKYKAYRGEPVLNEEQKSRQYQVIL